MKDFVEIICLIIDIDFTISTALYLATMGKEGRGLVIALLVVWILISVWIIARFIKRRSKKNEKK